MAFGFKSRLGYQLRLLSSMKENPLLGIFFCLLKISHIFHRFPIIYAKRNQQICRMCDTPALLRCFVRNQLFLLIYSIIVYVIGAIIRENLARNAQGVFSATSGMVWKVSISQERMNWIYGVVSGA